MDQTDYITLETFNNGEEVHLIGDEIGLRRFAEHLLGLIERTKEGYFEHDHLMSPSWGGEFLSDEPQAIDSKVVNHLKVYCDKGDKMQ